MIGLRRIGLELRALFSPAPRGEWINIDGYQLRPVADNLWTCIPDLTWPLGFKRHDGTLFQLSVSFQTDLASTPWFVQSVPGLKKTDLGPAAVIHDWLYQSHHAGKDLLGFGESNKCLEEMLLTLRPPYRTYRRCEALAIRDACDLFGRGVWDGTQKVLP